MGPGVHFVSNGGINKVPVPDIMWKIVIDPDLNAGIVFIVENRRNPTSTNNICPNHGQPNPCHGADGWFREPNNQRFGDQRGYCCEIFQFIQFMGYVGTQMSDVKINGVEIKDYVQGNGFRTLNVNSVAPHFYFI